MTKLERYKEQLRRLEEKRGRLLRSGNLVKAASLHIEIENVQKLIKQVEDYEEWCKPKPVRDLFSDEELQEMNIIPLMIECHLIADLLTAITYEIVDKLRNHGFESVYFSKDLEDVIKKSEFFAGFLTSLTPELRDLLLQNDTLNEALHKKIVNYMNQRLKTPKQN